VKSLLRTLIIIFGLLSLGTFFGSFFLAQKVYTLFPGKDGPPLNYHFSLYLPDNRNAFFTGIIQGARRAAEELDAAVSIHSIDPEKNELEMAAYTGVDGVIVCPYLEDGTARLYLNRLDAMQIPTVLINHNVPNDQPWPFTGANNFEVGRTIGMLAGKSSDGPIRLAIVYSDKAPGFYGERELIEMGIAAAMEGRLASPVIGLRTKLNPLDAEALLYRLFRSSTAANINTIVFTDSNDTIAAAQALIDMNMVGRIKVIGFGSGEGIEDNIRKGIIACSITINPERIGYEALRSLEALRRTGYTSASINTGIEIIDGDSLP
jgi:ribose transport system substrate-binding protein